MEDLKFELVRSGDRDITLRCTMVDNISISSNLLTFYDNGNIIRHRAIRRELGLSLTEDGRLRRHG